MLVPFDRLLQRICAWNCTVLLALAAPLRAEAPPIAEEVAFSPWRFLAAFELPEVPEPSGMCFEPASTTFYLVDDGGPQRPAGVYQVDQSGQVLRSLALGKDLEGICHDPGMQRLYAADEAGERIWIIDEPSLALLGFFDVEREWESAEVLEAGGNGFEGIEYVGSTPEGHGNYLLLLNQDDPAALCRVDLGDGTLGIDPGRRTAPISGFKLLPELNAGELHYDTERGELWVVHSWQNVYEVLDIDSLAQLSWEVCPGLAQEALCFDNAGRLWIGSDSGGLACYGRQQD